MANRYFDTGFYRSPFVRGLKGSLKALYSYIICDCSGAGIWIKDLKIASEYTGFNQTEKEFEDCFVKTGKAVFLGNGKFLFPDFIQHQYPKGFSLKNPAQINFIKELQKYNLLDSELKFSLKGLKRPIDGSISNGNGICIGNGEGNGNPAPPKPKLVFPYDSNEFMSSWNLLMENNKWKKKDFASLQAALKKLSKVDEQSAIEAIEDALAGNYQGIFPSKKTTSIQTPKPGTGDRTKEDYNTVFGT